jgi:hypothetical protein
MKSKLLFLLLSLAILAVHIHESNSAPSPSETSTTTEEDYSDESETTTPTSTENESNNYEEEEDENEDDSSSFEDEEEESSSTEKKSTPYNCPSECKCVFNKVSDDSASSHSNNQDEDYQTEKSQKRRRRMVVNYVNETGSTEDLDEENEQDADESSKSGDSGLKHRKENAKYEIHVDCSSQYLSTITNLFDYDFPFEQIISFNLSSNRFKQLKLNDGFEDLKSLRELDLSNNLYLTAMSPRNFLKKFRHLQTIHLDKMSQFKCASKTTMKMDCKWFV